MTSDDRPTPPETPDAPSAPPEPADKTPTIPVSPPDVFSATASPGMNAQVLSQMPTQVGFGVSFNQPPQPTDAIIAKLKDEHLTLVIQQAEKDNERKYRENIVSKVLVAVIIIGVAIFILVLSNMFLSYQKSEMLQPLLTLFLGYAAGVTSGIGISRYTAGKGEPGSK
jgi:hypothetical protein